MATLSDYLYYDERIVDREIVEVEMSASTVTWRVRATNRITQEIVVKEYSESISELTPGFAYMRFTSDDPSMYDTLRSILWERTMEIDNKTIREHTPAVLNLHLYRSI